MGKQKQNKTQHCNFSENVSKNLNVTRKLQINRQIILDCLIFLWLKWTVFKNKPLNSGVFMPLFHKNCNWKDGQFDLKSPLSAEGQDSSSIHTTRSAWQTGNNLCLHCCIFFICCIAKRCYFPSHKDSSINIIQKRKNKPPKKPNKTKTKAKTKNKTWRSRKNMLSTLGTNIEHF